MPDLDSVMKDAGYPGDAPPPKGAVKDAPKPGEKAAPPHEPGMVERGLEAVHGFNESFNTGVERGIAGYTGIPRAANQALGYFNPELSTKLSDIADQVPGVKRLHEFAEEPSKNWGETLGWLASLPLAGPGLGAAKLAQLANAARTARAAAAAKTATAATTLPGKFYTGGIGFTPTKSMGSAPGWPGGAVPSWAAPVPKAAASSAIKTAPSSFPARAAKTVAGGAAAGAVTDPEDPLAGAAAGGAAAPLLGGAGAVMRSGPGQRFVEHLTGPGLYFTIAHQLTRYGIHPAAAYGVAAAIAGGHWARSPLALAVENVSKKTGRKVGGALRRTPGAAIGAGAGAAEGRLEKEGVGKPVTIEPGAQPDDDLPEGAVTR